MKLYYAHVGQNATIGSPHPITGLLSRYGYCVAFNSKKNRDTFVDEFHCPSSRYKCVKTSISGARQYFLGMSVAEYRQYMEEIHPMDHDEQYND